MARVQVNGTTLEYSTTGTGPALLFIHGLGSCQQDWEQQNAAFSQHYQVITFDLRGHGQSDKPAGPYSIQMFAADAAGVLQALGIRCAHVVGFSLGGAVAFQMALDYPQLVQTLTIVNSGPEAMIRTVKEKLAIWMRFFIIRRFGMAALGKGLGKRLFPQPENEQVRAAFIARLSCNDKQAYQHALRALIGWSVTARLGSISCPMLAIAADQDYTPLSFKEAYVARVPGARLAVVPDARHALPMEKPAQFNAILRNFLPAAA